MQEPNGFWFAVHEHRWQTEPLSLAAVPKMSIDLLLCQVVVQCMGSCPASQAQVQGCPGLPDFGHILVALVVATTSTVGIPTVTAAAGRSSKKNLAPSNYALGSGPQPCTSQGFPIDNHDLDR